MHHFVRNNQNFFFTLFSTSPNLDNLTFNRPRALSCTYSIVVQLFTVRDSHLIFLLIPMHLSEIRAQYTSNIGWQYLPRFLKSPSFAVEHDELKSSALTYSRQACFYLSRYFTSNVPHRHSLVNARTSLTLLHGIIAPANKQPWIISRHAYRVLAAIAWCFS